MFDIGMLELLIIGVVALIVVGPKDLPKMFQTLGNAMGRIKGMAREFQRAMNDAARESGVEGAAKDLRSAGNIAKDLRKMTSPKAMGLDALKDAASSLDNWTPDDGAEPATETERLAARRANENRERIAAAHASAEARAAARQAEEGAGGPEEASSPSTGSSQT